MYSTTVIISIITKKYITRVSYIILPLVYQYIWHANRHFYISATVCVIFAFLVATLNTFFFVHGGETSTPWIATFDTYNTFRLISVLYNFAGIMYIYFYVYKTSGDFKIMAYAKNPLWVLANRLLMYPFVQAATRLGINIP